MKVIVAGLPKTGTKSMSAALKKLGYNVYDFLENLYYLENEWEKIFKNKYDKGLFQKMYDNVDAVADLPACHFWEEIHRDFPDAKIILTVRDSEDVWLKSLMHHIEKLDNHVLARIIQVFEIMQGRMAGLMLTLSYKVILGIDRTVLGKKTTMNELLLKMKYRAHNAHVIQINNKYKILKKQTLDRQEPHNSR
uniref:uncharacterized protein LOC120348108 isoform X2 n=1 Tax=Styela clava TaxID=7725 RepID=UPI00193A75D9|nr:uncharacterized protein LOC120348108 isoform X2 [Styela clava]